MATSTPERISVGVGLCLVMLATLPRFIANGLETRQTLMGLAILVVAVVMAINFKMLHATARKRLPSLLTSMLLAMVAGLVIMAVWHRLTSDWFSWQELISNGATLGLLLHALNLWRKPLS